MAQGRKSSQSGHQGAMTMPKNQVNPPSRANGMPRSPREKFVYCDPLAIDKRLLYKTPDGKYRIGLILETEQQPNGYFLVRQAAPSALTDAGVRGKIVGNWKIISPHWDKNGDRKKTAPNGAANSLKNGQQGKAER
jgi:hypothetical protein